MRIEPRKRFGQHFLIDGHIIERILALLSPTASQHLIEIGPGIGALTLPLLSRVKTLQAIELDRDVIPVLRAKAAKLDANLDVIQQDVLKVDFAALKNDERLLRVFGNLPYNISTPLIFHLLSYAPVIEDMVFMLQKEVADRLAAAPQSSDYGRLSVMVQYYADVELHFIVPSDAFNPPPAVLSRMVTLLPHRVLPVVAKDEAVFAEVVKCAFNQRRKTLRNSLKHFTPPIPWDTIDVANEKRPEELSVADFVIIANSVTQG